LIAYYRRLKAEAVDRGIVANSDMWVWITGTHRPVVEMLDAADHQRVGDALLKVALGPLVAGYLNFESNDRLKADRWARRREAKHIVDKLISLSEALACAPARCVEQGAWEYRDRDIDLKAILRSIEEKAGFEIAPPRAGGGTFGLRVGPNVFCMRDLIAIYVAARLRQLLPDQKERCVAEIGGGTGSLAYYLVKAEMGRVSVYDLPTVSIVQGYYLMRSLDSAQVWLYGEPASETAAAEVKPFWTVADLSDKSVDAFVNVDSLPEIELSAALDYMRLIQAKAKHFFLSINQEGQAPFGGVPQSVVYQLVERNGGFERVYRFPHWMRKTYVEELYRII
jgi:putative sugar O-methyltransferase